MQEIQQAVSELENLIYRLQVLFSLGFYALAIILSFILTSTPRTIEARFRLFLVSTLNCAAEWILVSDQLDPVAEQVIVLSPVPVTGNGYQ